MSTAQQQAVHLVRQAVHMLHAALAKNTAIDEAIRAKRADITGHVYGNVPEIVSRNSVEGEHRVELAGGFLVVMTITVGIEATQLVAVRDGEDVRFAALEGNEDGNALVQYRPVTLTELNEPHVQPIERALSGWVSEQLQALE